MAQNKKKPDQKFAAQNRKARHTYFIEDTFEAGMMLTGTEVKSLREGRATISEAYATVRGNDIVLLNAHIPEQDDRARCCSTNAKFSALPMRCSATA